MKPIFILLFLIHVGCIAFCQNIGIGTTQPIAPLMISTGTNPQLHVRQTLNGEYARVRMQSGSNRFWDLAGLNSNVVANDRLHFFNSGFGNIMTLSGNGFVGIGNINPNAPLSFPATLGKKITLYPGATGDVGIGVSGNRLYLYGDNPNADVAFGYELGGAFRETFAIKPIGALAISGNTGQAGQVLSSGGSLNSAQWRSMSSVIPTYSTAATATLSGTGVLLQNANMNIILPRSARVMVWIDIAINQSCVFYPCTSRFNLSMLLNGTSIWSRQVNATHGDQVYRNDSHSLGPVILNLGAGSYSLAFTAFSIYSEPNIAIYPFAMVLTD